MPSHPSKYAPLTRYLRDQPGPQLVLTFAEIEAVLGSALPATAHQPAWWSRPLYWGQGRAWSGAGWRVVAVDRAAQRVTFARREDTP